jgi:GWxTD domain-containing protein
MPRKRLIKHSRKPGLIYQSPIDLRLRSYQDIIKELSYIASDDELNFLGNVSESKRQSALENFWKSRDPDRQTEKNEVFIEYYKRISSANSFFTNQKLTGWKTDFGFIYILFGNPDLIMNKNTGFASE